MFQKMFHRLIQRSPKFVVRWLFNIYPPYLGAGVEVTKISKEFDFLEVALRLRFYNRNYVGTQFGGSIYSMTDPHFMFLLMNRLGPEYVVWDYGAQIRFLRPGKTDLHARFELTNEQLGVIQASTKDGEKYVFDLPVQIKDVHGQVVAELKKTLYVRKKAK